MNPKVNSIIFTLSIILLVILSMFVGSILDFDNILNLIKKEDSSTSMREPVLVVNTKKEEVAAPKESLTPPVEDIVETKVETKAEPKIEPETEPKVELSDAILPDTPKEKEEIQAKPETPSPEKTDTISGIYRKKVLSFPYAVYLGSYGGISNVEKASSDFEEIGINTTYWIKLDLGERGIWYRLFTGYFKTRKEADEFIKTFNLQGAESRIAKYANLIGTFNSKEEVEKYKTLLEEKGYSPYIIEDSDDTYQLYTGAFYQRDRAVEQNSSLALDDIESELVER